ncbi:efflux RND transporter permease subunit [Prolixibacter denitrificans]|uniref:Cobalt-zinc-cadmium resistance protein CzcA n=1 Tax=Prolixibacter denitrificans TaxID=1541063 RepID=A0A2P8C5J8_9BACT|nr:CusA/CzcA family heavy metal efflux RND transporter [Prolixibacter denitrificans]PSK80226.1 cobalt-zinc-cadmium resistance protein CzcA [Prolixibacter denitrificans]GET23050.1 cytochrome-c peroxidase [Prolixibacter denitrificans]
MIDKIINISLKNRIIILLLAIAVGALGYWSYKNVPIDAFPDVTPPMVQIFTSSPGLSPVDVETQISYPVEISMYGLPNVERVQSTSIFGLSRVNVYFEEGTEIYFARRLVMERLLKAKESIPEGLGTPELGPLTTGLGQVLMYSLEVDKDTSYSLMEMRTVQDWIIKPRMRTIPGVTEVLGIGGDVKQFQVNVNMNALLSRNLTMEEVREALISNNRNIGASFIERAGEEFLVRGFGWIRPHNEGLEDIRNILVSEQHGTPVTIGQIATVEHGPEIKRGTMIANGKETVGGFVLKLWGSNTQDILDGMDKQIASINSSLPKGMKLVPFYTQATLVEKAVGTVTSSLGIGAVLVVIVLLLFLGNVRSTFIVLISIPVSVLIAFIGLKSVGLTADLMSLGGLAIGIGMMVDGSIVVVENVMRHVKDQKQKGIKISMVRLVGEATREVGRPIVFAVAIIILVFIPLFTLQGTEGKLFSPMAYSISFAMLGALLVAITLTPVITSYLIKEKAKDREPRFIGYLRKKYRVFLNRAIKHPFIVVGVAVVLLLGSLAIVPFLGTEFVPTLREGDIVIRSTLPPGANLTTTVDYAKKIQKSILDFPEVEGAYARVGRAEIGGDPEPVNVVMTIIPLLPLDEWESGRTYEELQSAMAEKLEKEVPGLANNVSQPIQLRTDELMTGIKAQVAISIYGRDLDELNEIGAQIRDISKETPGAVDVKMQQQSGKPQIEITPDRAELARLGVSVDEFFNTVEMAIGGKTSGQVFEGIRRFNIYTRLQEDQRNRLDLIRELPIKTAKGNVVPLDQVADIAVFVGPKMISRNKASRRIYVQLNVRGRDMGSVVQDIQNAVKNEVDMPAGYFVEYGGQFENQQRSMKRLSVVVPITFALIFLMLFFAFGSPRYASLIISNVPFALLGGIFALFISGLYLSVPAVVGFIAVFGIAVQNGVVLVDYINQQRASGKDMHEAILTGSEHRLRPVLMTAMTTILGLLPLMLASDIGSNVQRPLATVVVGGLVTSTLLTLVVLPSIYKWFSPPRKGVEL